MAVMWWTARGWRRASGNFWGRKMDERMNNNIPPYAAMPEKKDGNTFGIVSLICGVIALLLFCTCLNIPLAIMSVIFGVVQIVNYKEKLLAGIGIALSAASLILMILAIIVLMGMNLNIGSGNVPDINDYNSYEEYFEQYFNNLEDGSF